MFPGSSWEFKINLQLLFPILFYKDKFKIEYIVLIISRNINYTENKRSCHIVLKPSLNGWDIADMAINTNQSINQYYK